MKLNIENNEFANEVADIVRKTEPDAEVYLFGSRARGDFREDSDYDFFILLQGLVDYQRKENLLGKLYDFQLEHLNFFDVIIKNKTDISSENIFTYTPFYKNIKEEMIKI